MVAGSSNRLAVGFGAAALWSLLALAAPVRAQVDINLIDTVPSGLTITNAGQFTLEYEVVGTTNGVEVNFFRDDGDLTVVAIPDPTNPAPPFQVVLPLRTNVDRDPNQFTAVARDLVTNELDLEGPFTMVADDVGPESPVVTDPVFPATVYFPTLTISGTVLNQEPGVPVLPETGGTIVVRRTDNQVTIGGGAITSNSDFVAAADISSMILGTPTDIDIWAVDLAGNAGTTLTVQVTRLQAAAPTVTATIEPPAGTITRDPGVTIRGTVTGDVEPFTVNVFVDGLLESQVTGLATDQDFIHTINLPGEGPHTISVQAVNGLQPPTVGLAVPLGTITLDRTPPDAPTVLRPSMSQGPLYTNAASFTIEGFSAERDTVPTDAFAPDILLQGPPGVTFDPASPLAIETATGRFETVVDISRLEDGDYFVDVIARDEAENLGPDSTTRVAFTVDRTPPQAERIRVDGIVAPQVNPEIYVGQRSVPIEVTFSEAMPTPPDLFVTQEGGDQVPVGRSSTTTRVVEWIHGVIPGFDGPVLVEVQGGADRAGNAMDASFERLFVVDTVAPNLISVDPADLTTVNASPERVRVRMEDPPSPVGTFSGVDLEESVITVVGPIGSESRTVAGTLTPYDPFTLDWVPVEPLTQDGTYRVSIVPQDKVGNRANNVVSSFILDSRPIVLSPSNTLTNPEHGACVGASTMPGGAEDPFVEVTITDPSFDVNASDLVVRDFCRVPPEVPGRKQIVDTDTMRYVFDDPLPTDGSRDGVYAIQVDAFDLAGNASPTYTTTYVYDTTIPSVESTFPASGTAVNGPLRIVDATMLDPRRDFCRPAGGISKTTSTLTLTLQQPNPRVNLSDAETPVRGVLRFESVGDVERLLLEIVDRNGFPRGLRVDGGDDGVYRIDTRAFDCAGNQSPSVIATFVYDTLRPTLEVDDLVDGGFVTGPDFTLGGRFTDDQGGSGPDRVTLTLESVDRFGNRTTAPWFLDEEAELDPVNLDDPDPTVEWTYVGDLRRIPDGTRARLRVRAHDRAGNFDERLFSLTVGEGKLRPPQRSWPRCDSTTSAQILTFRWEPQHQAARFRVRIVTPNGDVVERETTENTNSLEVNLTALPDPEGRFTWAVASVDALGNVGPFTANCPFSVDRQRPRVIAIDVVDPSPEAVGSINEGLVRITLHFSEDMDTARAPVVRVQPERQSVPPLVVQQLSYDARLWQGEVIIPEAAEGIPDHNGIAEIQVTGAHDTGGNENIPPLGGISLFEIDTGPFFRVAVFRNPVDEQDVILVVKGFQRDGGLPEEIVDPPSVLVFRQGQPDQTPTLYRIHEASFRGTFRLDKNSSTDVRLRISGRDRQGNTSTREITLAVERIRPDRGVRIQTRGLSVDLEAGAVRRPVSVVSLGATDALHPAAPAEELELVAALGQVGPLGTGLERPVRVVAARDELPEDLDRVGLFRHEARGFVFLGAEVTEEGLAGTTRKLGPMLALRDVVAPRLGELEARWERGILHLRVPVTEAGSGVDPGASGFLVGGRRVPGRYDTSTGVLEARLTAGDAAAGEELIATAPDRLGNLGRSVQAVVPAPAFGISEAVAYPNPARHRSTLRYNLNQPVTSVTIEIFDAAGRRVRTLAGPPGAGIQTVAWDLRDRRGRGVANGVYLARITARAADGRARERIRLAVLR